ncbi:MAG: hypothetical protein ABSG22_10205 [Sedimentisphaerales bacterium]|jgi:hypothetical protein
MITVYVLQGREKRYVGIVLPVKQQKSYGIFDNVIISTITRGWFACKIMSFETVAAGHISPLRTIIACAILTAEKLLENTSGIDMVN